jgi:hypothetical protein
VVNLQLPEIRAFPDGGLSQRKERLVTKIRQDPKKARSWRPLAFRTAVASAALIAALAVLSIVNVFGSNGPSLVDKAVAALARPENAILHMKVISTDSDKSGGIIASTSENWAAMTAPFARREILTSEGGVAVETGGAPGEPEQIYDPSTNTIYQYQAPQKGTAPKDASQPADSTREMILGLLESGGAKEDGHETVDGRDAMRILSTKDYGTDSGGKAYETVYLVDAKTGDPIEWRVTREGKNASLRFAVYEYLPSTPENLALLSLAGQHPDAALITDPAAYRDAESRVYPKS